MRFKAGDLIYFFYMGTRQYRLVTGFQTWPSGHTDYLLVPVNTQDQLGLADLKPDTITFTGSRERYLGEYELEMLHGHRIA